MFQKLLAGEVDGDGNETVRAVKKDLDGFEEVFRKSDLRFTAGKGQRRLEGAGAKVAEPMLSVLAKHTVLEVQKWQPPSCFASIEKHRSLQYEAGGFGSLRLTTKGERALLIAYVLFLGFQKSVKSLAFLQHSIAFHQKFSKSAIPIPLQQLSL